MQPKKDTHEAKRLDLGKVTQLTKGGALSVNDNQNGLRPIFAGLTAD
ncbi:hypothetical protein HT136_03340 [Novosphingobium profundi]|nr:hypothetical protein [Novosphingobium profundi]MBT0667399.1 hypothetical protein [Novosphingobium profundi]